MDFEKLAQELVRALRGSRSQPWLSRRIGLRSNLVYRWEAGRAYPSAQQFFRICRASKASGSLDLRTFLGGPERRLDLESERGIGKLLERIAGPMSISAIAERVGQSRFVVSRWLSGKTRIRLPDLLRFIDATTLRLLDFLSIHVDPGTLTATKGAWRRLQAVREAAYEAPWSHAVLRAIELDEYVRGRPRGDAWIGERLGIEPGEVERALTLLLRSRQIEKRGGRYCVVQSGLVDTGVDRHRRRALRAFWSRVAIDRLERGSEGVHAYNLFTVAERDVEQIRQWHAEFFERVRGLVAHSAPAERVVLYSAQLVALDAEAT